MVGTRIFFSSSVWHNNTVTLSFENNAYLTGQFHANLKNGKGIQQKQTIASKICLVFVE